MTLKETLRITSAGSVDDGKSTILARLLLDSGSIYDDLLPTNLDPNKIADLLDGLESEQSQGITIDVAHRFFDSDSRRYHIADSPGHEQYTRNMATASAGSDALMLVVDVQAGLKSQTKLHLEIALRLGIRRVIFAVNKMDLVSFSQKSFDKVSQQIESHLESRSSNFPNIHHRVIPVSGLTGANVVKKSTKLSWFSGGTVLETFDSIERETTSPKQTIVSIQMIQRISGGGRRYLGRVIAGEISVNQKLFCGHRELKVTALLEAGETTNKAKTNSAISFEIDSDLDIQRGDLLTEIEMAAHDQFEVDLIWLSEDEGLKGRKYFLHSNSRETGVVLTKINALELETDAKQGEKSNIRANEIVRANISLSRQQVLLPFHEDFTLGRFTLVSPETGQTIAVGTARFALRRSENITAQVFAVGPPELAELTGNAPRVIWFTGLSGSGKSTIADQLSTELYEQSRSHCVLDGDNLRFGLNRDLGFSASDRTENIRRTAEVAKLMVDSGLIVLVSLISPIDADREMARDIIGENRFRLVHVNTAIEVCEARDPKGLYAKARNGDLPNLPGLGSRYEEPGTPDLVMSEYDFAKLEPLLG